MHASTSQAYEKATFIPIAEEREAKLEQRCRGGQRSLILALISFASAAAVFALASNRVSLTKRSFGSLAVDSPPVSIVCAVSVGGSTTMRRCSLGDKDPAAFDVSCAYIEMRGDRTHMCLIHSKDIPCDEKRCVLHRRLKDTRFCCCSSHGCNSLSLLRNASSPASS